MSTAVNHDGKAGGGARQRAPTHPGELLREDVLPALGIPVARLAEALGVSRQALHKVLAGKSSITPAMAIRLGAFLGNGPTLWLRMQQAHDLWTVRQRIGERQLQRIAEEGRKLDHHGEPA